MFVKWSFIARRYHFSDASLTLKNKRSWGLNVLLACAKVTAFFILLILPLRWLARTQLVMWPEAAHVCQSTDQAFTPHELSTLVMCKCHAAGRLDAVHMEGCGRLPFVTFDIAAVVCKRLLKEGRQQGVKYERRIFFKWRPIIISAIIHETRDTLL